MMDKLPIPVRDWLYNLVSNERSVAYLKIDAELVIVETGGNLGYYGLSSLQINKTAVDQLDFMQALLPCDEPPVNIPMVELPEGRVADLHIFAENNSIWIIFLDATAERNNRQRIQQKAYEMTLLQE